MNPRIGLSAKNGTGVAPLVGMGKKFDEIPANASSTQKMELGKLKKLSTEYESFFMKEVISSMRQTVQKGGNLDGGNAEEIFTSMLDDQLAGSMSKQGNSGIAQELYNRLSKTYMAVSQAKNGAGK
jgi:flagellar protein FlgJ